MATNPKPEKRDMGWIAVIVVVGLIVLYPLSMGPATRLLWQTDFEYEAIYEAFYAPIIWVADRNEWASSVVSDYNSSFIPTPF